MPWRLSFKSKWIVIACLLNAGALLAQSNALSSSPAAPSPANRAQVQEAIAIANRAVASYSELLKSEGALPDSAKDAQVVAEYKALSESVQVGRVPIMASPLLALLTTLDDASRNAALSSAQRMADVSRAIMDGSTANATDSLTLARQFQRAAAQLGDASQAVHAAAERQALFEDYTVKGLADNLALVAKCFGGSGPR